MKKIYYYTLTSILTFFMCVTMGFAQNKISVTGEIKDGDNFSSLPGVSILVKNTKMGAVTDQSGKFKLNEVSPNATLVISYTGYTTQEVNVSGRSVINLSLASSTQEIETVVISGYGIKTSAKNNTSATSKVDAATLRNTTAVSATEFLQGKVAGVDVVTNDGTPGSGLNINIRGRASLSGGSSPLFVIDGIPYPISNSDVTNPTANINPNDIESMDVLKDASATALYGVGAANGVVVITTKRGKQGKPLINFSFKSGAGEFSRSIETQSPKDYALMRAAIVREYAGNIIDANNSFFRMTLYPGRPSLPEMLAVYDPSISYEKGESIQQLFSAEKLTNLTGVNWLKEITQNTTKKFYDFDISGATPTGTSYFWSMGYANETGAIKNSAFDRFTTRLNIEQKLGKIFTAGVRMQYARTAFDGLIGDNRAENAIAQANFLNPYINLDNITGENVNAFNNGGGGLALENPKYRIDNIHSYRFNNGFIGNLSVTVKPLSWLGITVQTGLTNDNKDREYFVPTRLREAQGTLGKATTNPENDLKWSFAPRINIDKKIKNIVGMNVALVYEKKSS
ncbi:MAG: TonB-dependent receptor plug domain-containing protein, partial [Pseudarcicella sp.]|nr:TonB-dependent receptor plug domain-containing protein [Pseudarcicella sp.]